MHAIPDNKRPQGVLTVLALYAVAEGVSQTGGLDILMNKVLGRASSVFWAQVRMMLPVMIVRARGAGGQDGAGLGGAGQGGTARRSSSPQRGRGVEPRRCGA